MSSIEEITLYQKIEAYGEGMTFKPQEDDFGKVALCPEKKFYLRDLNVNGKIRWLPYHHFPANYPALYDFDYMSKETARSLWEDQQRDGNQLIWVCPEVFLRVPEEIWSEIRSKQDSPLSVLMTGLSSMGSEASLYGVYHDKNRSFENTILKARNISVDLWRKLEDSDPREDIIPEFPDPPVGLIAGHHIVTYTILGMLQKLNNPVTLQFALKGN